MPGISRLFEVRPRALWISAPPPPSRYTVGSRRVCLALNARSPAADISVRRLARTSANQRLRDRQRQNLFLGKHLLCAGNALSYPSNGPCSGRMNGNPSNPIVYGWAGVILAQSPLQSLTKLSHRTKFGHPSGDDGSTPFDLRYSLRSSTHNRRRED